jgi:hypothetical protein
MVLNLPLKNQNKLMTDVLKCNIFGFIMAASQTSTKRSDVGYGAALGMAFGTVSRHSLRHGLKHGVSAKEGDGGPHIHHEQGYGDGLAHCRRKTRERPATASRTAGDGLEHGSQP